MVHSPLGWLHEVGMRWVVDVGDIGFFLFGLFVVVTKQGQCTLGALTLLGGWCRADFPVRNGTNCSR